MPSAKPPRTRTAAPRASAGTPAPAVDGRVRLQKVLAEAGIASRRACEELILAGEIEVDGETVRTLPCLVDPRTARIEVRGVAIDVRPSMASSARTVMVFKPRGVVSTNRDPFGRRRAIDIVPQAPCERLYPVGRLDIDSSGLLLLTNDGELANRLTHPRYGVHKGYEVMVAGRIDEEALGRLQRGVFLAHRRRAGAARAAAERIEVLRRDRDRSVLFIELSEGRNRQIRRMLEQLGHDVKRLRRVSLGPLKLSGLRPGQWRELTPAEAESLRRTAFGRSSRTASPPKRASYPKSRPARASSPPRPDASSAAAAAKRLPAREARAGIAASKVAASKAAAAKKPPKGGGHSAGRRGETKARATAGRRGRRSSPR